MRRLMYFSVVLILSACGAKEVLHPYDEDSKIRGLATPIQLSGGETEVILEDYFLDVLQIDSIVAPPCFKVNLAEEKKTVVLIADNERIPRLSELKVWVDGVDYSIIMRKSRKQLVQITYKPTGKEPKSVQLAGQLNDWNPAQTNLEKVGEGWQIKLWLNPGKYQYKVVVDGEWILDPSNPETEDNNIGGVNSVLRVGNVQYENLPKLYPDRAEGKKVRILFENPVDEFFVFWENYRLDSDFVSIDNSGVTITIPANADGLQRSHLRLWAFNSEGESNDLLIPLEGRRVVSSTSQLSRSDLHTQVMYSLMVDRFNNADPENDYHVSDPMVNPKVNYYGGDIKGITMKIRDGYFRSLGVNTLWISPITQNPLGAYGMYPTPKTKFSGYHGYWPISSSKVDFRFGTSDDLNTMIDEAHQCGINVILDYVANHVHQEHPLYQNNPHWATPLYLPDGTMNTEKWDEHRLTTWFDTFMPTLDLENPEVYEPMTDSALFWVTHYPFDGFRHDATKHIPEVFWRTLTRKIKQNMSHKRTIFQIGETYGSHDLISGYISSGMLNSQFDFNVYDAAVSTFARKNVPFSDLNSKLIEGFGYYGWHNLMGIITGNHDKARFISYAGGALSFDEDAKLAGWTRHVGVGDTIGYNKLQLLNAFIFTIPGVPTIYQGDEFGQPGANDPDNRKMMQFGNLLPKEEETLQITKKLAHLRRGNMALCYGTFDPLLVNDSSYAFARTYFGNKVIVVFNNSASPSNVMVNLPKGLQGISWQSNFGSSHAENDGTLEISLKPYSFEVLTSRL